MKVVKSYVMENGIELLAIKENGLVRFTGSSTGDHFIFDDLKDARIKAHWDGYKSAAVEAYENFVARWD